MNYWYSPLNLLFTLCVFCAGAKGNTFYSLNALNIKNEKVSFEEYKGKVSWFHVFTVFTARKRSLGQGDVFTPICQSFCARRVGCVVKGGVVDTPNPETDTPIDPEVACPQQLLAASRMHTACCAVAKHVVFLPAHNFTPLSIFLNFLVELVC